MTEELNKISASAALNSSFISTLVRPNILRAKKAGHGQNTTHTKIHKRYGVLRNSSMYAAESQPRMRAGPFLQ